jgi:hypothetical protein
MGIIFCLAYGWAKPKVNSYLGSLGVKQANPIVFIAFSTVSLKTHTPIASLADKCGQKR